MTLGRHHALTLPANPRAVKLARVWVSKVLHEIGRDDLVESAELGVSELVTNAIIHSTPPLAVRVRGTQAHPRIEVADRSLVPPRFSLLASSDDDLLTFGRGLGLVAVHSSAWGSDLDQDGHGKTVWFEPVREPDGTVAPVGELFDPDELLARTDVAQPPAETVGITLLGAPVEGLLDLLRYYSELRRELRLVALTNPDRYPLAVEFSDLATQVEQERRQSSGMEQELSDAGHAGATQVDLPGVTPATAPATMSALRDLLDRVFAFLEEETLLTPSPSTRQLEVQTWYLDEYVRQGAGGLPRAWAGGYADHRRHAVS